ncbi:MAG: amidohydrolase family protein [bacterium]
MSFHRELDLLVSTGIPPLDVLTIATNNGAWALGISDEIGTVEAGKRADLLVLRADPLKDIRNTREIDLVIMNGHRYQPSALLP